MISYLLCGLLQSKNNSFNNKVSYTRVKELSEERNGFLDDDSDEEEEEFLIINKI